MHSRPLGVREALMSMFAAYESSAQTSRLEPWTKARCKNVFVFGKLRTMTPLRKVRKSLFGYVPCQLRLLPALVLMGMVPCFVSPPKRGRDLKRKGAR